MAQTTDTETTATRNGHGANGEATAFRDTRAAAVLAYCSRLCAPERIAEAVDATFERALSDADDAQQRGGARDARLRAAMRYEAALRTPGARVADHGDVPAVRRMVERVADGHRGGTCELVPQLLAAQADSALSDEDVERLRSHLRRCGDCRTVRRRFEEAERAYDQLLPLTLARALTMPPPDSTEPEPEPEPPPRRFERDGVEVLTGTVAPEAEPEPLEAEIPEAEVVEPPVATPPAEQPDPAARLRAALPRLNVPDTSLPRLTQISLPRRVRLSPRARTYLARVLLVVGILLIAEAVTTVVWKEPFTAYLASRAQDALRGDLNRLDRSGVRLDAAQQRTLAQAADSRRRMALLAADLGSRARPGSALGWIDIPRIGVDYVFVQGTAAASLRKGPAHYTETPLPGEQGTVGVAGHRTTYLAPFRDIDALRRGDRIVLTMPYGRFTYSVEGHRIVPAGATDAFRTVGYQRIVLSACHPLYSSSQRILVSARLVASQPLGAAAVGGTSQPVHATAAQVQSQLIALGSRDLSLGNSGTDVKELQRLLGVPTTGYFGYETESAVTDVQRHNGQPQTGVADAAVKRVLAHRAHPPLRPPTPPTPAQ